MATQLTEEERKYFEAFLKEHPIDKDVEFEPDLYDDNRFSKQNKNAASRLVKLLLDGKI